MLELATALARRKICEGLVGALESWRRKSMDAIVVLLIAVSDDSDDGECDADGERVKQPIVFRSIITRKYQNKQLFLMCTCACDRSSLR